MKLPPRRWTLAIIPGILLLIGQVWAAEASTPEPNPLAGVIDFHCHTAPDVQNRSLSDFDLVREAKTDGMRGIVLKNHFSPTADRAELAMKEIGGIEVFGGIVLNRSVGGLNVEAIRRMAQMEGHRGKVVWLPTQDAQAQVLQSKSKQPFIAVVKDGKAVPELAEIFSFIAQNDIVLETGHSSAAEAIILADAAKKAGVKKIVITHAMALPLGGATDAQLQRMADLGAVIECTWLAQMGNTRSTPAPDGDPKVKLTDYVRVIKAIGAEHFLISSDMGQPGNPTHPEAMRAFVVGLKQAGLTDHEIDLVARVNPARLLGLDKAE